MTFDPAGLAALLGVGLLVAIAAGAWLTMHRLRRPPRRTAGWAAARGAPGDPSEIDTPRSFRSRELKIDGALIELWEIEGDAPSGPVVLTTPGWGDSRLGALPRLEALAPWSSTVVAWDPPGFGATRGECGLGVREARMLRELVSMYAAKDKGVVLHGWSLGGGASIAAGDACGVVGVIAEAPYRFAPTPARNVLSDAGLPHRITLPLAMWGLGTRLGLGPGWRGFDRASLAARVASPLLVIHGDDDAVCPVQDGREIARAAPQGSLIEIRGAGHNNLWSDPEHRSACLEAAWEFGARLTGNPVSSPG